MNQNYSLNSYQTRHYITRIRIINFELFIKCKPNILFRINGVLGVVVHPLCSYVFAFLIKLPNITLIHKKQISIFYHEICNYGADARKYLKRAKNITKATVRDAGLSNISKKNVALGLAGLGVFGAASGKQIRDAIKEKKEKNKEKKDK